MSLYDEITKAYPELNDSDFYRGGSISLKNDGDGSSDYIERWDYTKPIPAGLKLGK